MHCTHLRLTLPCLQPVHNAQLFRSLPCSHPTHFTQFSLRRPCWHCTRSHAIAPARSLPRGFAARAPWSVRSGSTRKRSKVGKISRKVKRRATLRLHSSVERARGHDAPARERHVRRERTPSREGGRRPPCGRVRRGVRRNARPLTRERARHRIVSSRGAQVRVRTPNARARHTRHGVVVPVRARHVRPGPALRHRRGFDAVSPGARRGASERRVRSRSRRRVRGVRDARARRRERFAGKKSQSHASVFSRGGRLLRRDRRSRKRRDARLITR